MKRKRESIHKRYREKEYYMSNDKVKTEKNESNQQTSRGKMDIYGSLALFIGFIAVAMVYTNPFVLLAVLFLALILCLSVGIKHKELFATAKSVFPIFLMLFIFSSFIYDVSAAKTDIAKHVYYTFYESKYLTIALTSGGILTGFGFITKMMIMVFASKLFSATTTIEEMLYVMNRVGLPYQFGLMLSIALRFIPTLKKEVSQIQQAQKSRGAMTNKERKKRGLPAGKGSSVQGVIPLFVPMIVSSMRRSDTMAMSMISRGYGYSGKRTQMINIPFGINQKLVYILLVVIIVVCVFVKKKYGFGIL